MAWAQAGSVKEGVIFWACAESKPRAAANTQCRTPGGEDSVYQESAACSRGPVDPWAPQAENKEGPEGLPPSSLEVMARVWAGGISADLAMSCGSDPHWVTDGATG